MGKAFDMMRDPVNIYPCEILRDGLQYSCANMANILYNAPLMLQRV
jgi:hypothetical protein